jgi:hypothetical protein
LDFWLRHKDKFTENWVFVDIIDLFAQMGQDLFTRLHSRTQTGLGPAQ